MLKMGLTVADKGTLSSFGSGNGKCLNQPSCPQLCCLRPQPVTAYILAWPTFLPWYCAVREPYDLGVVLLHSSLQEEAKVHIEVRGASAPAEPTFFRLVGGADCLGAWDLEAAAGTILPCSSLHSLSDLFGHQFGRHRTVPRCACFLGWQVCSGHDSDCQQAPACF